MDTPLQKEQLEALTRLFVDAFHQLYPDRKQLILMFGFEVDPGAPPADLEHRVVTHVSPDCQYDFAAACLLSGSQGIANTFYPPGDD